MIRILVADDETDIVESLKEMLAPYYEVDTATSGLEVLRMVKQKSYTGLILDVQFKPGMNGLEIAARLQSKNADIKIIIFSAFYSKEIQQQAIGLGAVLYEKPLSLEKIRKVMEAQG